MRHAFALIFACALLVLPAPAHAAPDPGGDEAATVSLPPPDGLMGFNEDAVGGLHGLSSTDNLELARAVGGNTVRTSLDWRHAEPAPGAWNETWWERWRVFYQGALDRGMTPFFTVGFAPTWARETQFQGCHSFGACEYPPARAHDDAWSRYVREVARRFPQAVIEVWNEPNLRAFWESGADPQRFAELQALAYDAVKSVSPQTTVLAGGLSNVQVSALGDMALREFLNRAYRAEPSLRGHTDAISFHPYPWSFELGAGSLFAKSFEDVRVASSAHGDAGIPLFVSEVGLPAVPLIVSEAQRSDLLQRVYRKTMTMPDVSGVVFHRTIEPIDTTANPMEGWYAWTRYGQNPPAPKPVYCDFVAAAERSYPGCAGERALSVAIEAAPSGRVPPGPVRFEFESPNYGATYECSLDGEAFTSCWSPADYTVGPGRHTFAVRARGRDGAASPAATASFHARGR